MLFCLAIVLVDLCPEFLRFSIFILFSSKTAGQIETKLHVEPLLDRGMQVCLWDLGHLIKVAAMPIYNKIFGKSSSQKPNGHDLWYSSCGHSSAMSF